MPENQKLTFGDANRISDIFEGSNLEDFSETIVFKGQKVQLTTQTGELNIAPNSDIAAHSISGDLTQVIDGDSTNAINVTGGLIEGSTDNTKRNIIYWSFQKASGSVSENTIGIIKTRPMPQTCLLYTSPSPRDGLLSRMPSSA